MLRPLFSQHGYEAVLMAAVADAADVAGQTVYNYFPAKQDLLLDRAEQIRAWYDRAVREREPAASPAAALEPLLKADIERYRTADLAVARGEFMPQSVAGPALRRFVLEERARQVLVVAEAITDTTPGLPVVISQIHAVALIGVVQCLHDRIGHCVLDRVKQHPATDELHAIARVAFGELTRTFSDHLTRDEHSPTDLGSTA